METSFTNELVHIQMQSYQIWIVCSLALIGCVSILGFFIYGVEKLFQRRADRQYRNHRARPERTKPARDNIRYFSSYSR